MNFINKFFHFSFLSPKFGHEMENFGFFAKKKDDKKQLLKFK